MKTQKKHPSLLTLCAVAIAGSLTINSASATYFYWNVASGDYATGSNWNPSGPPPGGGSPTNRSYINNGGTATLATGATGLGGFVLVGSASHLTVSGGTLTSDTIQLGSLNNATTGTMTISSGAVSTINAGSGYGYIQLGQYATDTGILNMSGGTLNTGASFSLGDYGTGQFNVTGGTTTIATTLALGTYGSSANGTLSLSAGSVTTSTGTITIARAGTGVANVTSTGTLKAGTTGAQAINIGLLAGSNGTLNVGTGGTAGTVTAAEITGGAGTATLNFNHTGSLSFATPLKGTLIVNKLGGGTTTLSGSNTYTGPTKISAGTMIVSGSATSSAFTVENGGTLGGTGSVGNVTVDAGGTLAPGNSPGILATGTLSLAGTLSATINGTTVGTQYNQTNVAGTVDLVTGNNITLSLGFTPTNGDNFFLIRNDGGDAITGLLNGYAQNSSFSLAGQDWKISYVGDFGTNSFTGGNDLVIQAIPEPATLALLAFSLTTVMALRRRSARTRRSRH